MPTCGSVYRRHGVRRAVKTLEMTERRMTPAQVSEAQQLSRDWSQLRRQLLIKGVCSTACPPNLQPDNAALSVAAFFDGPLSKDFDGLPTSASRAL